MLLRIGDFARLGRVTVKALRHYEEEGVLTPREVDRATGYRHYAPEQLQDLSWIVLLKDFGFRLDEIRRLLTAPAGLEAALATRREELRRAIQADARRLARLQAFEVLLRGEAQPSAVTLRPLEPVLAFTLRARASLESGLVTQMFEDAERRVARARARAHASPFLLFHEAVDWSDALDVEVCIPVDADVDGAREVPGAASAGSILYRGAYDQTPSLLATLGAWLRDSGHRPVGPVREVYHRFGAGQTGYRLPAQVLAGSPDGYVTELQVPIE